MATARAGPLSLTRVLHILRELAAHPEGLSLAELSGALHAPKSSLFSLLRAMREHGYLDRVDENYHLGPQAYVLAYGIIRASSLRRVARPHLERLTASCGETSLIGTLDRASNLMVYIDVVESSQAVRYAVPVGTARPLYASAGGRVLLACQPDGYRRSYLKTIRRVALTDATITEKAALVRKLDEIRATGLSVTMGEVSPEVGGFASPIRDGNDDVVAVLVIAAPLSRAAREEKRLSAAVISTALAISTGLGHALRA